MGLFVWSALGAAGELAMPKILGRKRFGDQQAAHGRDINKGSAIELDRFFPGGLKVPILPEIGIGEAAGLDHSRRTASATKVAQMVAMFACPHGIGLWRKCSKLWLTNLTDKDEAMKPDEESR